MRNLVKGYFWPMRGTLSLTFLFSRKLTIFCSAPAISFVAACRLTSISRPISVLLSL